jgi:hypothetical protein
MPVANRRILFIGFGSLLISSILYITANALPLWFVNFSFFIDISEIRKILQSMIRFFFRIK